MRITEIVCQLLQHPLGPTEDCEQPGRRVGAGRRIPDLEGIGEADSQPEVVKAIIDAPVQP